MSYFLFQREKNIEKIKKDEYVDLDFSYFSWNDNHKVNILNSIVFSNSSNNKVIEALLYCLVYYWKKNNKANHYYIFQILYDILMKSCI